MGVFTKRELTPFLKEVEKAFQDIQNERRSLRKRVLPEPDKTPSNGGLNGNEKN